MRISSKAFALIQLANPVLFIILSPSKVDEGSGLLVFARFLAALGMTVATLGFILNFTINFTCHPESA